MKDYFNLKNQTALITGCSSGLGVQMAKALASVECNIVALARRENLLLDVTETLKKEYGVDVLPIKCDINNNDDIDNALKKAIDKFGKIDILINNAGIGAQGKAEDFNDQDFIDDINTDLISLFKLTKLVAKKSMIPNAYGRIINIASMYGLVGNKIDPCISYHTAKGGVINMTRALAAEWAKYNITVNSICPGFFETPLVKDLLSDEKFKNNAKTMIPLERYGKEGELDTTVIYLASKYSTYVTGVNLPVDGGYTCM